MVLILLGTVAMQGDDVLLTSLPKQEKSMTINNNCVQVPSVCKVLVSLHHHLIYVILTSTNSLSIRACYNGIFYIHYWSGSIYRLKFVKLSGTVANAFYNVDKKKADRLHCASDGTDAYNLKHCCTTHVQCRCQRYVCHKVQQTP